MTFVALEDAYGHAHRRRQRPHDRAQGGCLHARGRRRARLPDLIERTDRVIDDDRRDRQSGVGTGLPIATVAFAMPLHGRSETGVPQVPVARSSAAAARHRAPQSRHAALRDETWQVRHRPPSHPLHPGWMRTTDGFRVSSAGASGGSHHAARSSHFACNRTTTTLDRRGARAAQWGRCPPCRHLQRSAPSRGTGGSSPGTAIVERSARRPSSSNKFGWAIATIVSLIINPVIIRY